MYVCLSVPLISLLIQHGLMTAKQQNSPKKKNTNVQGCKKMILTNKNSHKLCVRPDCLMRCKVICKVECFERSKFHVLNTGLLHSKINRFLQPPNREVMISCCNISKYLSSRGYLFFFFFGYTSYYILFQSIYDIHTL